MWPLSNLNKNQRLTQLGQKLQSQMRQYYQTEDITVDVTNIQKADDNMQVTPSWSREPTIDINIINNEALFEELTKQQREPHSILRPISLITGTSVSQSGFFFSQKDKAIVYLETLIDVFTAWNYEKYYYTLDAKKALNNALLISFLETRRLIEKRERKTVHPPGGIAQAINKNITKLQEEDNKITGIWGAIKKALHRIKMWWNGCGNNKGEYSSTSVNILQQFKNEWENRKLALIVFTGSQNDCTSIVGKASPDAHSSSVIPKNHNKK